MAPNGFGRALARVEQHVAAKDDLRALVGEEVNAFHCAGLEADYADNGAPGVRAQYGSEGAGLYAAALLLDPGGNNVEAVVREF